MLNMVNVNTQINILGHRNVSLPPGPGVLVYGAINVKDRSWCRKPQSHHRIDVNILSNKRPLMQGLDQPEQSQCEFLQSSRSSMSEPHGENQGEKIAHPLIGQSLEIKPSDWWNLWLGHLNVEISASEATKTIGMGGGIREGPHINLHINLHCIECCIRLRAGAARHRAKCG